MMFLVLLRRTKHYICLPDLIQSAGCCVCGTSNRCGQHVAHPLVDKLSNFNTHKFPEEGFSHLLFIKKNKCRH